jgi:ferric-dicitrate binding protein FerR (iron transport regulator)
VENSSRSKVKELYARVSKYAAILIILLAIPSVLWLVTRDNPAHYQTIELTENDPVRSVLLPDGSKIWINNNSTFSYPEAFNSKERIVTLEGEAFFQVRTDSLHPFIVKTNGMQVKVYGTVFNLNTRSKQNIAETTLVSGSVGIEDAEGENVAMLIPGQMASFDKTNKSLNLTQVNTDLYTSWHKGLFIFDKATLTDIATKIEEVYGVRVTVNTNKTVNYKANFVFRKTQPVDTVLEMLKFVLPIDYKKYNDQIYINLK